MNPSTLYGILTGHLYYGKRYSKAEDGVLGIMVKKRRWFKEKQLRPHWGEQTPFLAFNIQDFPFLVRSLGLLPNFKVFPSLRLYAISCKHGCSEYSASLQLNWFHKQFLVNYPKVGNILCSKIWYFSVSWRTKLQIIFHFTTHSHWPNYIM